MGTVGGEEMVMHLPQWFALSVTALLISGPLGLALIIGPSVDESEG